MADIAARLQESSMAEVLSPGMIAIWEKMCIGVCVVDRDGICRYMNELQRHTDGFSNMDVVGMHATELYLPHVRSQIPTMECLERGVPMLKKAYWYKTTTNYLFSSVSDFIPLFRKGKRDGVLTFTIWVDAIAAQHGEQKVSVPTKNEIGARYSFNHLVTEDPALLATVRHARLAAKSQASVMIWGESGTGKEVIAQAIHAESSRCKTPIVAVNCAAIPETLLEGILFGTTPGSYTGAQDKPGLFERANKGTLILDELNSMPMGLQAKLLRVIQEKTVRRLGALTEKAVDVRVISILNESPASAIASNRLRSDLYYRLAVVGVELPPLRKRLGDLPMLIASFVRRSGADIKGIRIDEGVMQLFRQYSWPGNVRELQHVIEGSLALLGSNRIITEECLPKHFLDSLHREEAAQKPAMPAETVCGMEDYSQVRRHSVISLKEKIGEYESRCIRNVLKVTGGNVSRAASIMDLTPAGLRYKIKQYGISEDDY